MEDHIKRQQEFKKKVEEEVAFWEDYYKYENHIPIKILGSVKNILKYSYLVIVDIDNEVVSYKKFQDKKEAKEYQKEMIEKYKDFDRKAIWMARAKNCNG